MLGILRVRTKPWILNPSSAHFHHHHHGFSSAAAATRHGHPPPQLRSLSSATFFSPGGAPVTEAVAGGIWRSGYDARRPWPMGEGSWNVPWDVRPARWLLRSDSGWVPFWLAPVGLWAGATGTFSGPESVGVDGEEEKSGSGSSDLNGNGGGGCDVGVSEDFNVVKSSDGFSHYKITGVLADGRCLFRAIAHGSCLLNGEEALDENRQRELADELRARVVEELSRRREEIEKFIEEDFDGYVKRIQEPYVWGGEPELLMASHVLKTAILVFMIDKKSGNLVSIANYGEEYRKEKAEGINVLFHGYGHYDLLEMTRQSCQKVNV